MINNGSGDIQCLELFPLWESMSVCLSACLLSACSSACWSCSSACLSAWCAMAGAWWLSLGENR